jgi:hypothetical protein
LKVLQSLSLAEFDIVNMSGRFELYEEGLVGDPFSFTSTNNDSSSHKDFVAPKEGAHLFACFWPFRNGRPVTKQSEDGQLQLKRKVAQVIGLLGKHDYHGGISHVLSLERTISGYVESKEFQE